MTNSNIIIIGSGPGGYRAAIHAAKHGLTVVIIEAAEAGGTCLNRGCIPTKTLCRNAEIMDTLNHADVFGLENLDYKLNFSSVMKHKDSIVGQLRSGVESLMQYPGITKVNGFAHFKDPKTVIVGTEEFTADYIIIATGSVAKLPPINGIHHQGVVTSTELLSIDHIPSRLCIIGAGVIGMEFASIFNSFGSKVTVVEFMKECLPVLDSDIAKRLRQTISKHGVEFSMQSAVASIEESEDGNGNRQLTVSYEKKGKQMQQTDADIVLIATGRKPNIEGLSLEKAGVETTPKGITVDKDFRTNIPYIYAIGDVNGQCMLAHAATFQGIHVINDILNKEDDINFDIMPSAIFTNPEAASVGPSEDLLKLGNIRYECRKGFYRSNGKALSMNETDGMLKLIVNTDNNKIIACHAFGAHASDIVQEVATLINMEATINKLADIIHIHPTLGEILHDTACLSQ